MQVRNIMHRSGKQSKKGPNHLMISKMSGLTVFEKEGTHIEEQNIPEIIIKLLFNRHSMKECLSVFCEKFLTETLPLKRYSTMTTIHMLLCIPQVQQVSSIYSGFCTVPNINHYFIYCPHCGLLHTVLSHFYVFSIQNQLL